MNIFNCELGLGDFPASVRLGQIEFGADWYDAGGINCCLRHVVVTLDVIEVDGLGDTRLLVQIHQVSLKIRVINNASDVALEVAVIDDVEPDQGAEKSPIGFNDAVAEEIAAL
jgi:hypothetical protein